MKIKISLPILATVVLSALKVSGVIAWSWLWVLCPLWIPFVIAILFTIAITIAVKGDTTKLDGFKKELRKILENKQK